MGNSEERRVCMVDMGVVRTESVALQDRRRSRVDSGEIYAVRMRARDGEVS